MYIPVLENGELVPITKGDIEEKYVTILDNVVKDIVCVCGDNLRSIILRGSVSYKRALPGISDLDVVIVLKKNKLEDQNKLEQLAEKETVKYNSVFSTIDLSSCIFEKCVMPENNRLYLNLTLTGRVLWGEDLISLLPLPRCDIRNAQRIARQTISESLETLELIKNKTEVKYMGRKRTCSFLGVWFMRSYCRGLIAFTMCKRRKFSLDVETCCEEFISEYPAYSQLIKECCEWERNPIDEWSGLFEKAKKAVDLYVFLATKHEFYREV